jgi:dipeptidyl aminopeptidase
MDESGKTKYPVLLAPYGGPNSQSVDVRYSVNWASLLAAEMKYIILVVDGRGTGFKGRDLRDPVRGQLGTFEAIDQIAVARTWASTKAYVDKRRVGIWGWSFGGCESTGCDPGLDPS